jgi:hypothetical protein
MLLIGIGGETYGGEAERMNFYPESCNVFLFEFSCKMSLDERGLKVMLVTAGKLFSQKDQVKGNLLVTRTVARSS